MVMFLHPINMRILFEPRHEKTSFYSTCTKCTLFRHLLVTALLESAEEEDGCRNIFMNKFSRNNLSDPGVNLGLATTLSCVGNELAPRLENFSF